MNFLSTLHPQRNIIYDMAMSPDGKLIAIASNSPYVLENIDVASPSKKWKKIVRSQLVG